MNSSNNIISGHDEIEMLLPWYHTGKLDPEDTARVEAYLASHADMQDRLDLIAKERNEALHLNETGSSVPIMTADRFVTDVISGADNESAGLWHRFKHLLTAPASGSVGWVGAAAALTIFAQGAAIFLLAQPEPVQGYREASGEARTVGAGTFALVRFTDTASAPEIARLLKELDMTITEGPWAGRLFKVRIGPAKLRKGDRQRLLAALSARSDLVTLVTETR
ncbi:hypothetical protein [Anderseniella sp. Alg231-50]|uniref:hypothetical protein n=1 Tax=Anderseniella sp. Alg231-50 TaxID=1922226 RepID=UPI00307C58AC